MPLELTEEPPDPSYNRSDSLWRDIPQSRTLPPAQSALKPHLAAEGYRLYPFTIDTKAVFDHYVRLADVALSDYTFTNNFIWLSRSSGFYQIIEDCFCLFSLSGTDGLTMVLPPLGDAAHQPLALQACFAIMDAYNGNPWASKVDYVHQDFLQRLAREHDTAFAVQAQRLRADPARPDYIYRTEDLIQLKGNAYKTKRSEINQFRRSYPDCRLEALEPQHRNEIHTLIDTWMHNRLIHLTPDTLVNFFQTAEVERRAVDLALDHYERLGLEGLGLFIGDRLEGFTFGERINPAVASVLVEKTNVAIQGAAQYLFREFSKLFADCTYINVGDDLGLENLRKVKMSYRPALFGEKCTLRHYREPS